ncbi:YciI family protein [Phenylobacterium sp.]|uniref:YciI family protein n=1 Tax=Phenylobacterium sp. TaxID=1871053 RepID=UPI0035680B8C
MKYRCLIYFDEARHRALTPEAHVELTRACLAYDDELREAGRFITASPLRPVQTAATVRVTDGQVSATDGPFAETKEQLGGFIMIRARDLNEAIAVAAKIPVGWLGCVEVRPLPEAWPPDLERGEEANAAAMPG